MSQGSAKGLDLDEKLGDLGQKTAAGSAPVVLASDQPAIPVTGPLTDAQLRAVAVPISVASLPLPSGASTEATLLAIGGVLVDIRSDVDRIPSSPAREGGDVNVLNFPASQAVTGPLTDTQLRAAAVPVSGPVTDAQLRASAVPVSGPLTDAQLRAAVVPVDPSDRAGRVLGHVVVDNFPATQPVSAAALPLPAGAATEATLLTLTKPADQQHAIVDSGSVAVSNFPATQPVSGPLTDAQLRAAAVPVSGPLTDAQLRAAAIPISAAALPLPAGAATNVELELIRTKTDNLDVALSTRTKPSDQQHAIVDSSALPTGASTEATLLLIKAKTDNLDVLLSTRTKPADAQHVIVDSSAPIAVTGPLTDAQLRAAAVPVSGPLTDTQLRATAVPISAASLPLPAGAATNVELELIRTKTDNLDVALSTRTKPSDQQHAIIDSGSVAVSNFPATQPVSGPLTDVQLRATAVPVSGPLTDTQLRAAAVPISAAALPLPAGAATNVELELIRTKTDNLDVLLSTRTKPSDQQHVIIDSSAAIGVTGPLTDAQLRASAVPVRQPVVATATPSNVAASLASVTLFAANANRLQASIFNDSLTASIMVKYGATASATDFKVRIGPGGYFEFPQPIWPGRVDAIWDIANGSARCSEETS